MKYGLTTEHIALINGVFKKHVEVEEVILYGSRAKGTQRPGSDIDLTIKGRDLTLKQQNKIANELDDLLLPYKIDLSIHSHIENLELIEHIDRVGQVFYSKIS